MRDSRSHKSRTQSDAFSIGNVWKGQIDCSKGKESGITVCVSNYLQLLNAIQYWSPIHGLRPRT